MSRFVVLSLAALGACASAEIRPMDRYFDEGHYEEVVRAFEADSSLWSDEDAVYQVAVARSLPDSPVYDAELARASLDQFLTRFPDSERRAQVRHLSALVGEIVAVQEEADGLEAEAAVLSGRVDSLQAEVSEQTRAIEEARADIRQRDVELRALRQELQRLKAIDLRLNPPDSAS